MKLPDIFIPERNLNEQIESLRCPQEKKTVRLEEIKELTDLIIYKDLKPSRFGTYKNQNFSPFLRKDMVDGLFVEYGFPRVEFIQFKDSYALQNAIEYLLPSLMVNSENLPHYLMTKDVYIGLIYAEDKNRAEEIAENYREKFGFETQEIVSKIKEMSI